MIDTRLLINYEKSLAIPIAEQYKAKAIASQNSGAVVVTFGVIALESFVCSICSVPANLPKSP